jgi:pentatricopeptide repeat protein
MNKLLKVFGLNVFVNTTSLVDKYAKGGNIEDAWRVFDNMPSHDVALWTAMKLGCVKCGQRQKKFELFQ